jgi:hypothetical protein
MLKQHRGERPVAPAGIDEQNGRSARHVRVRAGPAIATNGSRECEIRMHSHAGMSNDERH